MFHVKYRDCFGKLHITEGRSEFEDAESEAEDYVRARIHSEVEILVDLSTADAHLKGTAAPFRRLPQTDRDDGAQAAAPPLR
jgi:hypothetical protein